jgi:hypothetical protein
MIAVVRDYLSEAWDAWTEFWFAPSSPTTLSAIRVLAGAMLLYTHLIWSMGLTQFFGDEGYLPKTLHQQMLDGPVDPNSPNPPEKYTNTMWTHFNYVNSSKLMWTIHIVALTVFFLLTVGLFSRVMAILAFLFAVSYANRITPGAYFGLDKINCMLAMYLMIGPCGARYSIDRLWRLRRGSNEVPATSSANLAIRLIQVHMCIIYLFSGIAKIGGVHWETGEATWLSFDLAEYRSLDMTWMLGHPLVMNLMTHITVFWELSYAALVWPALTRPWVLLTAIFVHGGIALFLGMPTFGLVMLIGNLAFVSPKLVRKIFDPFARRVSLAVVGKATRTGAAD